MPPVCSHLCAWIITVTGLCWTVETFAQTAADKPYGNDSANQCRNPYNFRSFLLSYENDLFAGTDRYYSQGVFLRVAHPAIGRLDMLHVLSPIAGKSVVYDAELHHEAYTPSTIRSDSILRGDRPYAGLAYASLHGTAYLHNEKSTLQTAMIIGIIGPAAGGREIQTLIHRATGDFIPLGWQHQIQNDLLLNYGLRYSANVLSKHNATLRLFSQADAGTLYDRLSAGMTTAFRPLQKSNIRLKPSIFGTVEGRVVAYDARLQGGIFNRHSPYTLTAAQVSRAVGTARVQARLDFGKVGIGGEYTWITREFIGGLPHAWGRLFIQVEQ